MDTTPTRPTINLPDPSSGTVGLRDALPTRRSIRQLPAGMTVSAVSPGSRPDTNAVRNAPFFMQGVLLPMFKIIPGMSHSVADGAGRYVEVVELGPEQTGKLVASKPKKMTGPILEIEMDHLVRPDLRRAEWDAKRPVSGNVGYPADQSGG